MVFSSASRAPAAPVEEALAAALVPEAAPEEAALEPAAVEARVVEAKVELA